jgi:hypothetical protein
LFLFLFLSSINWLFVDRDLKRIKLQRELEGFPITALREINSLLKA